MPFCGLRIFSCDDKWKEREEKKFYAHENRDMEVKKSLFGVCDNGSTISFISKIYHHEQLRIFSQTFCLRMKNTAWNWRKGWRMKTTSQKGNLSFISHFSYHRKHLSTTLRPPHAFILCVCSFCWRCDNFSFLPCGLEPFFNAKWKKSFSCVKLSSISLSNSHPIPSSFFARSCLMSTSKSARDNSIK